MTKRTKEQIELNKKLKEWSMLVRKRDNNTCQMCGNKGLVHAHHILPRTIKEYCLDLDNGITLCFSCHKMGNKSAHQNAIYFSNWLKMAKPYLYNTAMNKMEHYLLKK